MSHYEQKGIECIDVMRAISTDEQFTGFLQLNALKYLFRANFKDTRLQNIKKAKYYIDMLAQELEQKQEQEQSAE